MTPRPELLLESRLCVALMPIIRRQRHSPNVLRFLQIDSAVSRSLWIDVHDIGYCAFVCGQDVNPDFHAHAQRDGSENQGTVEIDDECLAFAHQSFAHTESLNPNLQTNPGAPPGFTSNRLGGHSHPPLLHSRPQSPWYLSALAEPLNMQGTISPRARAVQPDLYDFCVVRFGCGS